MKYNRTDLCHYDDLSYMKKRKRERSQQTNVEKEEVNNEEQTEQISAFNKELDGIKLQLKGLQETILSKLADESQNREEEFKTNENQFYCNNCTPLSSLENQSATQPGVREIREEGWEGRKDLENRKIIELSRTFEVHPESPVNIYGGPPTQLIRYSRVNNHGVLSWIATLLNDPFLNPIYRSTIWSSKSKTLKAPLWSKSKQLAKTPENEEFTAQFLDRTGLSEVRPLEESFDDHQKGNEKRAKETVQLEEDIKVEQQNKHTYSIPKYRTSLKAPLKKQSVGHLKEIILHNLPTKKVIWLLIDRFFLYIYPFCPCLDQNEFIDKISGLIGGLCMEDVSVDELHVSKLLDIANIGSLLLVLQLGWLSLRLNGEQQPDNPGRTIEEKYLLDHPVSKDLVNNAQRCIDEFNLLGRCALDLFQTLLLMKFFRNVTGSDGFSDGRQQIFLSLLTHIGMTVGLNRDPTNYSSVGDINHSNEILRKIWYSLEWYSTLQSVTLGIEPQIDSRYYDTRIPKFSRETSNIRNLEVESETVEGIVQQHEMSNMVNDLLNLLLDMKHTPAIGEILYRMKIIEDYMSKKWGSLSDILTPTNGVHSSNLRKTRDIYCYIQSSMLIFSVYHHLLLAFEREQNCHACVHFLQRCLFYSFEIVNKVAEIMEHSYRYVGTGLDYFINTYMEITTHNSLLIQISLYIRLCCLQKTLQKKSVRKCRFKKKSVIIEQISRIKNDMLNNKFTPMLEHFKLVKDHTFFAWLTMGVCSSIFRFLRENNVKPFVKKYNFLSHLSEDEILKLLYSIEGQVHQNDGKRNGNVSDPEEAFEKADIQLAADFDRLWATSMQSDYKSDDSFQKNRTFSFFDDLTINWQRFYDLAVGPFSMEELGNQYYDPHIQQFSTETGENLTAALHTSTPEDETAAKQQRDVNNGSYLDGWT